MMENKNRLSCIIIIGVLLISTVFFGLNYFFVSKELQEVKATASKTELNTKVLDFASLFIKKVLQANTEVDFETRLSLENAVRDLKDDQIMAEWQNFTASKTEADAQNSVKKLLGILISKIQK
jgi:hypothetical protein